MQITAIVAPFHPDASRPNLVTPRASDGVDEFIGAVGAAAGAETHVIEGSLCDAPAEGFLILFSAEGLAEHPQLRARR